MTHEEQTAFGLMSKQDRAKWLLKQGIYAKTDIDPEALDLGYYPYSAGCKLLGAGKHETAAAAIDAGEQWLKLKAEEPQQETAHA